MGGLRVAVVGGVAAIGLLTLAGPAAAGISDPPNANDDAYSTPFQTAITLDSPAPTENDEQEVEGNTHEGTILTGPANGTLDRGEGENVDGVTYTPNAGFSGTDTFTYEYFTGFIFEEECVECDFEVRDGGIWAQATPAQCTQFGNGYGCFSTATVTITVGAAPATTTTTVAPPTTTTTVAAAASPILPVTGRASASLAWIGAVALVLGLGVLLRFRRYVRG